MRGKISLQMKCVACFAVLCSFRGVQGKGAQLIKQQVIGFSTLSNSKGGWTEVQPSRLDSMTWRVPTVIVGLKRPRTSLVDAKACDKEKIKSQKFPKIDAVCPGVTNSHSFFLEAVHCSFNLGRSPSESISDFVDAIIGVYLRGLSLQTVLEQYMFLDNVGYAFGRHEMHGFAGFRLTRTEVVHRSLWLQTVYLTLRLLSSPRLSFTSLATAAMEGVDPVELAAECEEAARREPMLLHVVDQALTSVAPEAEQPGDKSSGLGRWLREDSWVREPKARIYSSLSAAAGDPMRRAGASLSTPALLPLSQLVLLTRRIDSTRRVRFEL